MGVVAVIFIALFSAGAGYVVGTKAPGALDSRPPKVVVQRITETPPPPPWSKNQPANVDPGAAQQLPVTPPADPMLTEPNQR